MGATIGLSSALLLGAALEPGAAQTDRTVRIGALLNTNVGFSAEGLAEELRRLGYQEGRNLVLEVRRTDSARRNPALAAELVAAKPDLLVAVGSQQTVALKEATATTPIVFASVSDPVGLGVVASLARPGGNLTGLANFNPELGAKRLELISEVVPGARRIALLFNPTNPVNVASREATEAALAGTSRRFELVPVPVSEAEDVASAVEAAAARADALMVAPDLVTMAHDRQVAELAIARRLPAIFSYRHQAAAGGLIAYGVDPADSVRRTAALVDRILKGAKPSELPVENPATLRLVLNLATAEKIGVRFPASLLLLADEVIE